MLQLAFVCTAALAILGGAFIVAGVLVSELKLKKRKKAALDAAPEES